MKQNFSFIYKLLLLAGDTFALLLAFTLAFIFRVSLDSTPVASPVKALTYITLIASLLPIWLIVFALLGLYSKNNFERRPKEAGRLLVGSIFVVILIITFDFFSTEIILPAKLVPIYAVAISFVLLLTIRTLLRRLRLYLYKHGYGVMRVVLVGNSENTYFLSKYLAGNHGSGYKVVAVVANKSHIYEKCLNLQSSSLTKALEQKDVHGIIQTDGDESSKVYGRAIEEHLDYQFIPTHEALLTARHSVDLLGAFPMINVHTTPLIGYGRALKRVIDVSLALIGLIISLPFSLLIAIIMKLSDFKSPVLFKQKRLSRFNKTIDIYKFRSLKPTYNGLSPEEAFGKMDRPDLLEKYRKNGDQLDEDPRVTKLGNFLRRTSLDELPQLINVLKGDISLVGPRALVPAELSSYEFKNLILSVKSGLTGLAQISGRRDISFEERRKLDMYYVQNWSILLDLQIIVRTIFSVLRGNGAR